MSADNEDRLIELFNDALAIAPDARAQWLAQACAGDAALQAELAAMLPFAPSTDAQSDHWIKPLLHEMVRQSAVAHVQIGQMLGRYKIVGELGAGGMGQVWLAHDERMSRDVALKVLPPALRLDPQAVRRFEDEVRTAAALNHPNIMTVYEVGSDAEAPYFTCEHIAGVTLRARMESGALSWQQVVKLAVQIADALQTAHAANIIHRDIKPENVMLRTDGLVKVLDFGIAKQLRFAAFADGAENQSADGKAGYQTSYTRGLLGTPNYMSPEQARGERLTTQTDVFSFGLLLYEMLAGHPYAALPTAEKLAALQSDAELPALAELRPDIPAALAELVTRATRKALTARNTTAAQMHATLEELHSALELRSADRSQQLAQARADKLLNQAAALYANDAATRLSLTEWWTIRRWATAQRGRLERKLLRKSLVSALRKGLWIACLAGFVTLAVLAWNSVEEKWDERIFRDGHSRAARRVVFSPDGKRLATWGDEGRIIIWDFMRRRQITTIAAQNRDPLGLDFSLDGKWLAHGDGQTIVIREAENPQRIVTVLSGSRSEVKAIGFSPDSNLLASGDNNAKTVIWAVESWKKLRELDGYVCYAKNLFYADSRRLLLSDGVWDMLSGKGVKKADNCFRAIAPNDRLTVSVDYLGNVAFFDLQSWRQIKSERVHQLHGRAAAFSHDGRFAVTGAEDIALWDINTLLVIARFEHSDNVWDLCFSPDDRWLVSAHGDGSILVWDMERRKRVADLAGHSDKVAAVAFSPSGDRIASASFDQSVNVWNTSTGVKETSFTDHMTALNRIWFLNEDTILASDRDANFYWHSPLPQQRPSLPVFAEGSLDISPNKRWVIRGKTLYDWQAQRVAFDFSSLCNGYGTEQAFSSDSRWLVLTTGQRLDQLFLFDLEAQRVVESVDLSGLSLIRFGFTPDNRQLIAGCSDGEIVLLEVTPLRLKKILGKHRDHIQAIAVSASGTQVVSASDDRTLAWWDLTRGKLIYRHSQSAPILGLAFSPNDRQVVTGGQDKSVRVYTRRRSFWGMPLD